MSNRTRYYTLVQHSGYGYNKDPGWAFAVEEMSISATEARSVIDAGGVIYTSYTEANNAAYEINYPASNQGIYPAVRGGFSRKKINGLAVYTPNADEQLGDVTELEAPQSSHSITMRAACACGWEYGPSVQTDVTAMVRYHQAQNNTLNTRGAFTTHRVRFTAKCDCGWYVHDLAGTPARKEAANHRAGRDWKATA